jgi:N,N'-diacetyllegionaminate synthase
MKGPDHKASLEPDSLRAMVEAIRNLEKMLGDGIKGPSPSELKNMPIVRKSIIASKDITKGEIFTKENIAVKRPGTGISPTEWEKVVGQVAKINFKEDEVIKL